MFGADNGDKHQEPMSRWCTRWLRTTSTGGWWLMPVDGEIYGYYNEA